MSVEKLEQMMEKQQMEFQAMRDAYLADLAKAHDELASQRAQASPQFSFDLEQPRPEVGSVAIRLPTFWLSRPEASFETRNPKITTDMSKYNHVLQLCVLLHI